jgi:hypothetical protein
MVAAPALDHALVAGYALGSCEGSRRCDDSPPLAAVVGEYVVLAEHLASVRAALSPERIGPCGEASVD